jgi:hypothetical protein
MVCKPDPVGRLVKLKAVLMHIAGSNFQDRGRTASGTYFSGGVHVRGKVYVEASPFCQSPFQNRREKPLRRSMVESIGRDSRLQFEVNGDGMSLAGPDIEPVQAELKPLLVVVFDDSKQLNPVEFQAFLAAPGQQAFDIRPSLGIQGYLDRLRFVTKNQAEELSIRKPRFFHSRIQVFFFQAASVLRVLIDVGAQNDPGPA